MCGNGGQDLYGSFDPDQISYNFMADGDCAGINGNITGTTLPIVNYFGDDYHLVQDSPCINAGDNDALGLNLITVDMDNEARIDSGSGIVDMGADEYYD